MCRHDNKDATARSFAALDHAFDRDARIAHRGETLESQVRALEGELRRLSEEVSTDALTQGKLAFLELTRK